MPTFAVQLAGKALSVGVNVAVKLEDCVVVIVLVTVAVTDTRLPGPVQSSGSSIRAVEGGAAGMIVKAWLTVPKQPFESVALIVIGKVPDCVGVPDKTPLDESVIPAGSALDVLNVVVPIPPV